MVDLNIPVRVGDTVDNVWLGELARSVNAQHVGLVDNSYFSLAGGDYYQRSADKLHTRFVFGRYKRRPPYIVVCTASVTVYNSGGAPSTTSFGIWLTPWPNISPAITMPETTAGNPAFWNEDAISKGVQLDNFSSMGIPDAYGVCQKADGVSGGMVTTAIKVIEDNLPQRHTYTEGVEDDPYDEWLSVVFGLLGSTDANDSVAVTTASLTIIGGR